MLALYAGKRVAVRWRDEHGDLAVVGGMPWPVEGNEAVIMTPSNRPGQYTTRIPMDPIISVEIMAYDAVIRDD